MPRQSVFGYFTSQATLPRAVIAELITFLIGHRDLIQTQAASRPLFATRPLVNTPLTLLAQHAIDLGKTDNFSLLKVPPKTVAFPESLTFKHIPFDLKQLPTDLAGALQHLPDLRDKIVLNITAFLKLSGQFSDVTEFQNLLVRDLLSRSFFLASTATWLTPRLSLVIAKIYSMSLGSAIAEWYQLNMTERGIIATILSFYILQQVSSVDTALTLLRAQRKYLYLPESTDLEQILGHIETSNGSLSLPTLDAAYKAINELGIDRMTLNRRVVLNRAAKWGPDPYTSSLALEYPPYFVYLILLAISGVKIGLNFRLKASNLVREAQDFADELRNCATFLPLI